MSGSSSRYYKLSSDDQYTAFSGGVTKTPTRKRAFQCRVLDFRCYASALN